MSAPVIGIPNNPNVFTVTMLTLRSCHSAELSPVQWNAYRPEERNVERERMNGLSVGMMDNKAELKRVCKRRRKREREQKKTSK